MQYYRKNTDNMFDKNAINIKKNKAQYEHLESHETFFLLKTDQGFKIYEYFIWPYLIISK